MKQDKTRFVIATLILTTRLRPASGTTPWHGEIHEKHENGIRRHGTSNAWTSQGWHRFSKQVYIAVPFLPLFSLAELPSSSFGDQLLILKCKNYRIALI